MRSPLLLAVAETTQQNVSIFDPASPQADSIRNLAILVLAITGGIFLVVEGIIFYTMFRFRQGAPPGAPPPTEEPKVPPSVAVEPAGSTAEPPQVYGSQPIEIAWTAAPALIVFILILVIGRTLWEVAPDHPEPTKGDNAVYITVIGRQWWWEYRYDYYNGRKYGFTTANELHIPISDTEDDIKAGKGVARPIYLTLQSADVCHSFWVPRLAGKTDLIPGRTNRMSFHTSEPGLYVGQCAEFCGTQHAKMLLRVVAESPESFESWLRNEAAPAPEDEKSPDGKSVFLREQSCASCHPVRGTENESPARKRGYAPDLTHLMSRKTLASGIIENDREGKNLRDWVKDPQTFKPGCLMAPFKQLPESELNSLMRYLLSLR
ncbi:MAG TPA: cytochrome c oxidase subunit II [Gemmataceae bacterium]|nr:cytochrome c oxidase subunit II [Gemmataceae bacterium]